MVKFDAEELTSEKGLFDIYRKSRWIKVNPWNQVATIAFFVASCIYVGISNESYSEIAAKARLLSTSGFAYASLVIGFLIAGFTIFATISKPDMFIAMAQRPSEETDNRLSWLKYIFFSIMKVFIFYLAFCVYSFCFNFFGDKRGLLSIIISNIPYSDPESTPYRVIVYRMLADSSLVIISTWFFHLFVIFKSFLYNIYIGVMMTIRWEFQKQTVCNNQGDVIPAQESV